MQFFKITGKRTKSTIGEMPPHTLFCFEGSEDLWVSEDLPSRLHGETLMRAKQITGALMSGDGSDWGDFHIDTAVIALEALDIDIED